MTRFQITRASFVAASTAFLAIAAAGCASLSLRGVTSATAPDQPKSGPGGSGYRHADWVVDSGGTDEQFALGDTPEHRFNGVWSDGVPVRELKIQKAAPIVP